MRKYTYYNRYKRPKLDYPENSVDYIEYEIHQIKRSTGDGPDDFEIEDKVEETKTNIVNFINSFADEVGVDAVLKRAALTGDLNLLNQKEAQFMDTTIIPDDPEEAFKKAQAVEEAFNSIDPALTNGQTMEDFYKGMTEEKLNEYINKKVEEKLKEREKDNESNK